MRAYFKIADGNTRILINVLNTKQNQIPHFLSILLLTKLVSPIGNFPIRLINDPR